MKNLSEEAESGCENFQGSQVTHWKWQTQTWGIRARKKHESGTCKMKKKKKISAPKHTLTLMKFQNPKEIWASLKISREHVFSSVKLKTGRQQDNAFKIPDENDF